MTRRYWLVLIAALGIALHYRNPVRATVKRAYANVRAFDMPTAGMYDAIWASLLGGFYSRVADEVAATCPSGTVLEVGSGPGRLGVRLARSAPRLNVTGVDLSPEMVELANHRAAEAGLPGERVRFKVGDVGALPYADRRFDGVVSTLSLHHWPDPALGLAEIHRILKPGGRPGSTTWGTGCGCRQTAIPASTGWRPRARSVAGRSRWFAGRGRCRRSCCCACGGTEEGPCLPLTAAFR